LIFPFGDKLPGSALLLGFLSSREVKLTST
jgi:hypothetical protein